ncbi:MAG: hypothetical protein AAF492_24685, partial [Verrucomicrobiota bacterium]
RVRRVLDVLAHLYRHGDKRWRFIVTLRSDFFERCRISPDFWSLLEAEQLVMSLDELDEEGWRAAIKGPAARAGAYLEAGLIESLLKDVYRQRGSMPLLQLALYELWRLRVGACLTSAAYHDSLGGLGNVLQKRAMTGLRELGEDHEYGEEYTELTRNLFIRLTSPGEGVSDSRRRLDRNEMMWENTDPDRLNAVLETLSGPDYRLIVTDEQAVEVTHEVLIRDCSTIRAWIEDVRGEIPMLRRLSGASARWAEHGEDEAFLNPADPLKQLKKWSIATTIRLTPVERDFIRQARAAEARKLSEDRRQRQSLRRSERRRMRVAWSFVAAMVLATIVVGIIAAVALRARDAAERARVDADHARENVENYMVKSLERVIGSGGPEELEGLWELAALPETSDRVREVLLDRWFRTSDLYFIQWGERPSDHPASRAAIGFSTQRFQRVMEFR